MTDARPLGWPARHELILYATPSGLLADQCERYFAAVTVGLGQTTAQTFPPHCTLSGFFRRTDSGTERAVNEMLPVIAAAGPVPDGAVKVVQLVVNDRWVGLELQSPWLTELTAAAAAAHTVEPGDDALRLKDWLHLSLAYEKPTEQSWASQPLNITPYGTLAKQLVDAEAAVSWEVGLWERSAEHKWTRH